MRSMASADPIGVATVYDGLLDGIVIDDLDAAAKTALEARGLHVCVTDTMMTDAARKRALADAILEFGTRCGAAAAVPA